MKGLSLWSVLLQLRIKVSIHCSNLFSSSFGKICRSYYDRHDWRRCTFLKPFGHFWLFYHDLTHFLVPLLQAELVWGCPKI